MSMVIPSPGTIGSGLLTLAGSLTPFGYKAIPTKDDPWIHDPNYYSWQNLSSGAAYQGIKAVQINDVVQWPVVPNNPLSPNSVEDMFSDTARLGRDKIFTYFNNLPASNGYIDKAAAEVNSEDPFNLGGMFSTTTKILAAAIIGYLIIK